jgi:hypothetical protein
MVYMQRIGTRQMEVEKEHGCAGQELSRTYNAGGLWCFDWETIGLDCSASSGFVCCSMFALNL